MAGVGCLADADRPLFGLLGTVRGASTCTQDVTVTDVTAPAIDGCPSDITITANPNNCSPAVTWTAPTATDNCEVSGMTASHTSGDNFNIGTIMVMMCVKY